jgi:hypothetical protein
MIVRTRIATIVALLAFAPQTRLSAQIPLKPWTGEFSVYAGGTFDFPGAGSAVYDCLVSGPCMSQSKLGRRTQPVVGGTLSLALTRSLWVYGDYGYMFADRQETSVTLSVPVPGLTPLKFTDTNTTSRQYWTAAGGVELSFPTIHRIVPFFRAGAGYVHQSYNSFTDPNFLALYPSERLSHQAIPSGTLGGGVRWYWGERQGLRFLVDGFFLGHGVEELAQPGSGAGIPYVSRRSGGRITVGYFHHFGR